MKVYMYYLKSDKSLYAFTTEKKIKKEFENERNMNIFYKEVLDISDVEFSIMSFKNNNNMLFINILCDGYNDFEFVTTYEENNILENDCFELERKIESIARRLDDYNIKSKYNKTLSEILEYYGYEANDCLYHFDTFRLFLNRFKEMIFL